MALVRSLKILAELAMRSGRREAATRLRDLAEEMSRRINAVAWDGDWYLYGFTDEEKPFGTKADAEGKIYLNTQSWAILAGLADPARQRKLLASVDRHLDGTHGLALFSPAYTRWDPALGRISMFSEGTKENAAVFCHAAMFTIVADLMVGRGTIAHRRMRAVMPNTQPSYELYKTEPYAFAEYLVGPDSPYRHGEGGFTWITGTAGWFLMLVTEWLLGARHEVEGLRIDPCLPKAWRRARIVRPFRGASYDIEILKPRGLEKGRPSITVDGAPITSW
jgi:cellobiose phosphorylase